MLEELENRFRKRVQKDKKIQNAYLLIHSEKHGIHLKLAEGQTKDVPAHPDQLYFISSIDKLLISVIIGMFVEQGRLSYSDPVYTQLHPEFLRHLHVYKGKDYTNEIKISHLLNHTSGLYDFVKDKPAHGQSMMDMLPHESTFFPTNLIQWAKALLTPHFPPGQGFYYSNTNYYLLSLIIEKLAGKPVHKAYTNLLFRPLEMRYTYMLQQSRPLVRHKKPVAHCYIGNIDLARNRKIGLDHAGGRIVSTTEDLLKFMKTLVNGQIIRKGTLNAMKDWASFSRRIDYGYGIMNIKSIPLFMPKKYNVWGYAGLSGSFMFYHPEMETYFIGSLNRFGYQKKAMTLMYKMIDILNKNGVGTDKEL